MERESQIHEAFQKEVLSFLQTRERRELARLEGLRARTHEENRSVVNFHLLASQRHHEWEQRERARAAMLAGSAREAGEPSEGKPCG